MKNTMTCPKCGCVDILRIPGDVRTYGVGNNIITGGTFRMQYVTVTRYLCTECGFSEEWIDSKEDIEELKTSFSDS